MFALPRFQHASRRRRFLVCVALFMLLWCRLSLAGGDDASPTHHRCLHGHSSTLESVSAHAAMLQVEYNDDAKATNAPFQNELNPSATRHALADRNVASRTMSALAADPPSPPPYSASGALPPIRIHFDVSHLFHAEHYCAAVGEQRKDKLGGNVTCTPTDLFSSWKRDFLLHRLLPTLATSVQQWLSVARDGDGRAAQRRATRIVVPQGICGANVDVPASHTNRGVDDTDFIVYVLAAPLHDTVTTSNARAAASTSSRTIAWATYCALDRQTDRPLVAMMNFVPSALLIPELNSAVLQGTDASLWQRLWKRGFSSIFSSSSADKNSGAPLTAEQLRAAVYHANEIMESYYAQWTAQHQRSLLHELLHALGFAPAQLLRYSTKESLTGAFKTATDAPPNRGDRSAASTSLFVVTAPKVRIAVQDWMSCNNSKALPGAALEHSGPDGTVGAHWERLLFHGDLMAGVLSPTAALSAMTIAFFDSLPYYRANEDFAEVPAWGHQAGCTFATGDCTPLSRFAAFTTADVTKTSALTSRIYEDSLTRLKYWCEATLPSSIGHTQCTSDRRAIGFCFAQLSSRGRRGASGNKKNNSSNANENVTVNSVTVSPAASRFTESAVESRGLSLLMEGCPIVEPYSNRMCDSSTMFDSAMDDDVSDGALQRSLLVEEQGYYFGPYSRCFATSNVRRVDRMDQRTLEQQGPPTPSLLPHNTSGGGVGDERAGTPAFATLFSARCLQTRCVRAGAAVEVRVGTSWIACPADGSAGVVTVPPSSGYTGWFGCEPAPLYCADATQLQKPSAFINATQQRAVLPDTALLPFYRVTVTFAMQFAATEFAGALMQPQLSSDAFNSRREGSRLSATLRATLVDSDCSFHAAVQSDVAQHRAALGLSPLGAVMRQRVVGATRLARASFALYGTSARGANRTTRGAVPFGFHALVSVDLEVVARNAAEAEAHTQSWLYAADATNFSTAVPVSAVHDGEQRANVLSGVHFGATAEWLSRASCSSALSANAFTQTDRPTLLSCVAAESGMSTSPSVLPRDDSWRNLAEEAKSVCQTSSKTHMFPVSWRAIVPKQSGSLSVVGPLDVSELARGTLDLRDVAVVHLRLRLADEAASRGATRASKSALKASARQVGFEKWIAQATTLLALSKDVSAVLGLSSQWVRVASIRHVGTTATAPEKTNDASPAAMEDPHKTASVAFVVSLPAFDNAVPFTQNFSTDSSTAGTPTMLTWPLFTELVQSAWQQQLADAVDLIKMPHNFCTLRHASVLFAEQHQKTNVDFNAGGLSRGRCAATCYVMLDALLNFHTPRPGASAEDLFSNPDVVQREPWWKRPVMQVRGLAVTAVHIIISVVIAIFLVVCAQRCGRC